MLTDVKFKTDDESPTSSSTERFQVRRKYESTANPSGGATGLAVLLFVCLPHQRQREAREQALNYTTIRDFAPSTRRLNRLLRRESTVQRRFSSQRVRSKSGAANAHVLFVLVKGKLC